ncbi:MAG: 50S ribosomal protein L32 [Chlamydiae bacterium]|nr:50S ribosomal protein L32 [Chlamydiota bacterium]
MAVPRTRTSNARKNQRRSHHGVKKQFLGKCTNCSNPKMPHQVCPHCGMYRGKQVLNIEQK